MSYFEEGNTLPPPFNIFPTMKTFMKFCGLRKKDKLKRMSTKVSTEHIIFFLFFYSSSFDYREGIKKKEKEIIDILQ